MNSRDGSELVRLLLDTHTFLWWLAGDEALSRKSREGIETEAEAVFVSAASVWEISTKHRLGKLPGASAIVGAMAETIESQGFMGLAIGVRHGQAAGALPGPHRDPFDRMLIAQAILDDLVLVSDERAFDAYGVRRLW
jgi:PIN domain nuclease of toxin-antitoxin system